MRAWKECLRKIQMAAIQKETFWEVLRTQVLIFLVLTLLKVEFLLTQDLVVGKKRELRVECRATQAKVTMISNSSRLWWCSCYSNSNPKSNLYLTPIVPQILQMPSLASKRSIILWMPTLIIPHLHRLPRILLAFLIKSSNKSRLRAIFSTVQRIEWISRLTLPIWIQIKLY